MPIIEKLGSFYLGRVYDLASGKRLEKPIMYDARHLVTHAVCVGMTGSGKTGLCVDLMEEAAIDRVPAIMIDPKGDIGNLLLTFPDLRPEDFEPWVNVDDARRKGMSIPEYARFVAEAWARGLAEWDQGPDRIRLLRGSADFRIYTPGSEAGLPISILSSLKAPSLSWEEDPELLRDQITGTVSALLGLVGITADPLQSREHILLSTIFEHSWRRNEDMDLARLISAIQTPPVRQVGVFDVDTFFPPKDRFALALALNNILASPAFATWLKGDPLDISTLLYDQAGVPRHSIFYIAHLTDAERMFFVTLLLEQVVSWMRRQAGTTSLRALLYFDEVFGFLPPVAMPPSKRPLLTLLKQARAFGLGIVLCTQNPVDLDYKALSNAGTWFIGKLQTDRDKARILDGLESASAAGGGQANRATLDRLISALSSRIFLLHNVHAEEPTVFETRWAMSYLRGPITKTQVRNLMAPRTVRQIGDTAPPRVMTARPVPLRPVPTAAPSPGTAYTTDPPVLNVPTVYLPVRVMPPRTLYAGMGEPPTLVYDAAFALVVSLAFVDSKLLLNVTRQAGLLVDAPNLVPITRWDQGQPLTLDPSVMLPNPEPQAWFGPVPAPLTTVAGLRSLERQGVEFLLQSQVLQLSYSPMLKLAARPEETEAEFRLRLQQAAREQRDAEVQALRRKARALVDRLEAQLEREERELARDRARLSARQKEELIAAGETLLGMFGVLGRRRTPSLSRIASKRHVATTAKHDVLESEQEVHRLRGELEALRRSLDEQADEVVRRWNEASSVIETYTIRPRRSDTRAILAALAWAPSWEVRDGSQVSRVPAWT